MLLPVNDLGLLKPLIIGGVGGAVVGTFTSKFIPKRPLRLALWIWLAIIGIRLVYTNLIKN
jgi:hypothetical protein